MSRQIIPTSKIVANHIRFLTKGASDNGPFIDEKIARHDIALACISYLNSTLEMGIFNSDNAYPNDVRRRRVGERLHHIHGYSTLFWFDHVMEYAAIETSFNFETPDNFLVCLGALLDALETTHDLEPVPPVATLSSAQKRNLRPFNNSPKIRKGLVSEALIRNISRGLVEG